MTLVHEVGEYIELHTPTLPDPLWRFDYGTRPKPFMHPLRTPAGCLLTNYEPYDHLWHRGLWYTIKFVGGDNFWEENEPFGTQDVLNHVALVALDGGGAAIHLDLGWFPPGSDQPRLTERRAVVYRPLDESSYAIDWLTSLEATEDVHLDRTEFTTWGGYGGLCLRGSRSWHDSEIRLADGTVTDRPTGPRAPWAALQGKLDGAPRHHAGVLMCDHPENPRYPTPWYGATGFGIYLNAAFLFHEPLDLAAGERLEMLHGVLAHDGLWSPDECQAAYEDWLRRVFGAEESDG